MAGMPERLQKHAQDIKDRKPKKDIPFMFKRVSELARRKLKSQASAGQSSERPSNSNKSSKKK